MFLFAHLRTFFAASFIAFAIVACGGSGASPAETPPSSSLQPSENGELDDPNADNQQLTAEEITLYMLTFLERAEGYRHTSHIPVDRIPESGTLTLYARFSEKPEGLVFSVVDEDGKIYSLLSSVGNNDSSGFGYTGDFEVPEGEFMFQVEGYLEEYGRFVTTLPTLYKGGDEVVF